MTNTEKIKDCGGGGGSGGSLPFIKNSFRKFQLVQV